MKDIRLNSIDNIGLDKLSDDKWSLVQVMIDLQQAIIRTSGDKYPLLQMAPWRKNKSNSTPPGAAYICVSKQGQHWFR